MWALAVSGGPPDRWSEGPSKGSALTTFEAQDAAAHVDPVSQSDVTAARSLSLQEARQLCDAPPPFPFGWYAVALCHELRAGAVLTRQFMDREIVVFRTEVWNGVRRRGRIARIWGPIWGMVARCVAKNCVVRFTASGSR